MKDNRDILGELAAIGISITIGVAIGSSISQETTSTWWKMHIVTRGYGTWETTIDG